MAPAIVNCVFAALLAVLSLHEIPPSTRVGTIPAGIVCPALTKRQVPSEIRRVCLERHVQPSLPSYTPQTTSKPVSADLFQRPPPASPLFS
jgi:hypothetical protein